MKTTFIMLIRTICALIALVGAAFFFDTTWISEHWFLCLMILICALIAAIDWNELLEKRKNDA